MSGLEHAKRIVQTLQLAGFEAYFVGGSVRDMLLGRPAQDIDIGTSATPEQVAALFPDHVPVGERFGVLLVKTEVGPFEVASFRTEAGYEDRRRPDSVAWATAKDDVARRDFTVNGLLYDPLTKEILDHVNGKRDLQLQLIRTIGDPKVRLHEDPLRVLRAIRLKNQLGFQYDKPTYDALKRMAPELAHISAERIADELNRMLDGPWRVDALDDLEDTGVLEVVLPEIAALKGTPQPVQYHQEGDVYDHTRKALLTLPVDAPLFLVWAVLFHDAGKPEVLGYGHVRDHLGGELGNQHLRGVGERASDQPRITTNDHATVSARLAETVLRRLKFPRTEIDTVTWLIEHHMSLMRIDQMRPARREAYVLDPRFPWLLELHKADASGTIPTDLSLYAANLKLYDRMRAEHSKARAERPGLLLDGHELQTHFVLPPGPNIGELLEHVRDAQLAGQITTKEDALKLIQGLLGS